MTSGHWPFFDLRIRTPRLELRPDWDDGLVALGELAAQGIHDPATMPFGQPWSDLPSGGELERSVLQWNWRQRAELTPDKWRLAFVVSVGGRIAGIQGIEAEHFARCRVVETGSWLGREFQGQGVGREMRAAVLHLAFAGLGATEALSGAFHDNAASLAVSRALGYGNNGEHIRLRRSDPDRMVELRLTRADWERHRWPEPIEIDGLEACLPLLV
jgi:RimJ/RimL family protein N-acetyltransferase